MLRRCQLIRSLVQYTELTTASTQLNSLLDIRSKNSPTPSDTLRQFIRINIIPILHGTSLDRRYDALQVRRAMNQLLRDATFAAIVLKARPRGTFVNSIINCIQHDHERMQFINKMSSNQASRIIEHLCRIGVKESDVFAVLVARLDFNQLKEITRAMFALAEEGLYNEVIFLIIPLYCGETWVPVFDGGENYNNQKNKNCNIFDAVRLLRVLSKAVRGVIEQRRRDEASSGIMNPLPLESIERLRTNLTIFIIENSHLIRGAHWINFTRAMIHFPQELKTMKYLEQNISIVEEVDKLKLPWRNSQNGISSSILLSTDDMAALGMERLFAPLEKQKSNVSSEEKFKKRNALDVPSIDLTKLLPIIKEISLPKVIQQKRFEFVIKSIVNDINSLSFADLVRFLQALRQIEGSAAFAPSLNASISALSIYLESFENTNTYYIPYQRLVQLATLISAFRVKSCRGFAIYLSKFIPTLETITVQDATSLMNALASIGELDGIELCSNIGEEILDKVGVINENSINNNNNNDNNLEILLSYPVPCSKLLRSSVLLSAKPSSNALSRIFCNNKREIKISEPLKSAGASVLFDVSRSLYHFCSMKRVDKDWEEEIWKKGIISSLLPLLKQFTFIFKEELLSDSNNLKRTSYVPLAWRSTMEAIFPYVDVNLDTISILIMQKRIEEIYPFCREIVLMGVSIAELQRRNIEGNSSLDSLPFSSNGIIHLLSFLLMFEHILYHGTWQAEINSNTNSNNNLKKEIKEKMQLMKEDYKKMLSTPVLSNNQKGEEKKEEDNITAITLLNKLFSLNSNENNNLNPLFNRNNILEITTNLPFAVSLVISQGPINEIFCESAVAAMIKSIE